MKFLIAALRSPSSYVFSVISKLQKISQFKIFKTCPENIFNMKESVINGKSLRDEDIIIVWER